MKNISINLEKISWIATILSFVLILITAGVGYVQLQEIKRQMKDENKIASLQNVLTINSQLYSEKNTGIIAAIGENQRIRNKNGGHYSDYELENFLGIFDSMDQVYIQGHLSINDLCEQFSYYVVSAYEYPEIKSYIREIRKNNENNFFGGFDDLYKVVKESGESDCR